VPPAPDKYLSKKQPMITVNKKQALQEFGQALTEVRESKNMSIPELAAKTGITPNIIGQIEQGKYDLEYTLLLQIAQGLDSRLYQLLPVP
jgi:transcriptional regulator with XRE-family HTH domain